MIEEHDTATPAADEVVTIEQTIAILHSCHMKALFVHAHA
jgi:hypothetical protein